ncbi:MAG: phosphohistidine phosphatase SixA [Candidatus Aminicenantales bacterium]
MTEEQAFLKSGSEASLMILYLVQHARAKSKEEDPERALSDEGVVEISKMASYVASLKIEVEEVFHSSKLRTKQTAEILTAKIQPERRISETDGLLPLDDPGVWGKRLQDINKNIVIVGHLPHLSKLASLLLCGDAEREVISFRNAGIVCLNRDNAGDWSLQWMVTPELIIVDHSRIISSVSC